MLWSFGQPGDGREPFSGVIFDRSGNLFGTTFEGGAGNTGTVFELMPTMSGWTDSILSNGGYPIAGLTWDAAGNLYGATSSGGSGGAGTVFELSPSNGSWTYTLLYSFTGGAQCGPWGTLVMDATGNLYGTTNCLGSDGAGSVFKLVHSGGAWTYTSLHDFTGGSDGGNPEGSVVFDASGKLYGTTSGGGSTDSGVVWEITP